MYLLGIAENVMGCVALNGYDMTKIIMSHIIYYDYQTRGKFYNMQLIKDGVINCDHVAANTFQIVELNPVPVNPANGDLNQNLNRWKSLTSMDIGVCLP